MALRLRPMAGFGPEQYEVVFEGRHVGRIYLANPHDKAGVNWYWGINWFERPRETAHQAGRWDGYAESRDAAMAAFRRGVGYYRTLMLPGERAPPGAKHMGVQIGVH